MAKINDSNLVNYESVEYINYMNESLLPRTLLGGTREMRNASTKFLPQNKFETATSYANRLKRSFLFGAYKKTLSFFGGQVFQKKLEFINEKESVNEFFEQYRKNIDNKGNNIDVFAKRNFVSGLGKGVSIILVEMPNREKPETKADEKTMNVRPYLKDIKPENIIGWKVDKQGRLSQIRIKGTQTQDVGEYGSKEVDQILILEPGKWELFVADDKGGFDKTPTEEGETSLDYIPVFAYIPGEEKSIITGETPLIDLAFLNEKHWQSSSDQNNILHVARVPILFGNKIDSKQIPIGASQIINSDEDGASLNYVEITGASISAGKQDLDDIKNEMALYGLQQLIPRTGNLTATEKSITSGETNSSLATWAIEYEDVIEAALSCMAEFMGETVEGQIVEINKEYFFSLDSGLLDIILKSVQMDIASRRMAFVELKRRGVYNNEDDWESTKDEIEEDQRTSKTFSDFGEDDGEDEE